MKSRNVLCALLALLMAVSLAGCGGSPSGSEPSGSGDSAAAGNADTIVVAYASGPSVLDPVMIPGDNATIWLTDLLFGTLLRPSSDGTRLDPYLADSWEANEDNSQYTFHLKQGVKFSDGSDVTAEDWVFSLLRARDTVESNWHASTDAVADVVALDENTIQVSLVEPRESFLSEISMFNNAVQSKAYVESIGDEENQLKPMGTGPYMIKEWKIGEYILFEKNPYYWDADNVATPYIRFNVVSDSSARMLQLESGEADIINEVPFNSIAELDAKDGISALGVGSTETQLVNFNVKHEILKDLRVRQALRYATDMDMIVDLVLSGFGTKATSYMTSSGLYYNEKLQPATYDVEKAKQLLSEAGYPDGFACTLVSNANQTTAEMIQAQLKEVGIEVTLNVTDFANWLDAITNGKQQMYYGGWTVPSGDASEAFAAFHSANMGPTNRSFYGSPEADELIDTIDSVTDEEQRMAACVELQELLADECVTIGTAVGVSFYSVNKSIEGFYSLATQSPDFAYITFTK